MGGKFEEKYSTEDIRNLAEEVKECRQKGMSYSQIRKKLNISDWVLSRVFDFIGQKPSARQKCRICGEYFYIDKPNTKTKYCSEECQDMAIILRRGVTLVWQSIEKHK